MLLALSLSPAWDKIIYIDGFEPGKLYRIGKVTGSAGGKGNNVARVARQLGEQVRVAGFVAGRTGKLLEAAMKELGINTSFIEVEGESRTNINIIDSSDNRETELLEAGPTIGAASVRAFMDVFSGLLPETDVLICSGGLPDGLPAGFYNKFIGAAAEKNIKVLFDSSGEVFKQGIKASPYLVKPNLRELVQYAGRSLVNTSEIIDVARQLLNKHGITIAVVSMGSEGALLVTADRVLRGRVPEVSAVNTIGSGDSMVAGLATAISRGYDIMSMFRLGLACSVANTQSEGAGSVDRELVGQYSGQIDIEVLD
jgi:1-phosphofructokinase/tagatose 6-phosphate kinase